MNISQIIGEMSLQEKIAFCTGADFWRTKELPRLGVPAIKMSDGPHGLRCQAGEADMIGVNKSLPATCFPTAVTAGATWNRELYAAEGEAIGKEALAAGVSVVLGPGCNIKRSPLGGRNFEYISEDPYQAGNMAAAFIRGQQSTGVSSSLKHFAANSQEYKRQNGNSQMDTRTLREIYLAAFETAVKEGQPGTVMCAYNKINGVHCSDSRELLTDILRSEWGFDGMVVTDWGALNDRIQGFQAGCDLNMPGGSRFMEQATLEAVKNGTLSEADIDASVARILRLVEKAQQATAPSVDWESHHALAQTIAEQGAVLLKNEGALLPLTSPDLVLIGHMAREMRYQGTGSSHINPTKLVNLTDAMRSVPFVDCCDAQGAVTGAALAEAAAAAKAHEIAIVVAGLPELYESEAFDRAHMGLPEGHNRMVEAVAAANPNTVVVLLGGSAMELPWANRVRAILYMGLPGQAGGQAIANLLTGRANPSGKLTETWPVSFSDVISRDTFGQRNVEYREGIYVGYRYYDKAGKAVRYPFGHGLSYTTFAYSDLNVDGRTVRIRIANTGAVRGAEVAQLYTASLKNLGLVYFCNYVLGSYNDGITQTMVSVIGGIPMGIGIFAVWPLAKRFGKRNVTMWGFVLYAIGSAVCCLVPTSMAVVLTGQFIKNIGGLPCAYVFMALFADTLDHVEWKTGIRCDGTAMSIYNIIAVATVGICTGIFNWMLASAGYIAPSIDAAGQTVAAVQPDSVLRVITFAFVGLEIITGAVLAVLLVFLNVEKTVTRKQVAIVAYRKAECEAAGKVWVDPDTAAAQEAARAEQESEAAYLAELKAKCAKNGWSYEEKAAEYRRKAAASKAKAEEKRLAADQKAEAKAQKQAQKRAVKLAKLRPEKLAAKKAKEAKKAAAIDRLWETEQQAGNACRAKIQAKLAARSQGGNTK